MSFRNLIQAPWVRITAFGFLLAVILLVVFGPKLPGNQHRSIVVGDDNLAHLMVGWQKTWQRSPTREEMLGLLQSHVRDEVLYREAVSRGMDANNAAVRRALILQMNLLAENQVEQSELTENEVQSYYNLRKDQYQRAPEISFRQTYFKGSNLDQLSELNLQQIIKNLNQDPKLYSEYGDPIMLQGEYYQQTPTQINNQFGADFASQLLQIGDTLWTGPITSSFGSHLVQVLEILTPGPTPLEQVWNEVVNDMLYEEKQAAKEQFYTELLRQYDISYQGITKELIDGE